MPDQFSGQVLYANGVPAAGVRVRVFDRDLRGDDDDLTLSEGLSDAQGAFGVTYERALAADTVSVTTTEPRSLFDWTLVQRTRTFADPLDRFLPYLQFRYTHRGQERTHTVPLAAGQREFRLPDPPPVSGRFTPSEHGFRFLNSFAGYPLPFTVPALPLLPNVPASYGLCGGMAAAAADFFFAGRRVPQQESVPDRRTALYRYLFRRQVDSFSPLGEPVLRFHRWGNMPEDGPLGTWQRTLAEFEQLRALFDSGVPAAPIGLVYAGPDAPLWENHQVLACGYTATPAGYDIRVYDPNYPLNEQVVVRCERVALQGLGGAGGLRCRRIARVGDGQGGARDDVRAARGFFLMPYTPVEPPAGL
ncbi:MAG TPA: hypothetical protein VNL77_19935 [Roseiflexaceae bacterium]|nr:hypothetical protein [Roseiflexaceae bacterium]